MGRIVLLSAAALAFGVLLPIVGRYAGGRLRLHASGYRAVLDELCQRRHGTLTPGPFLDPYPKVHFDSPLGPCELRHLFVRNEDEWVAVVVGSRGLVPSEFVMSSAKRRMRGYVRVKTDDPAFDEAIWVAERNATWLTYRLTPDVRAVITDFFSRSVANPLASVVPGRVAEWLRPRLAAKRVTNSKGELVVAEQRRFDTADDIDAFIDDALAVRDALLRYHRRVNAS